MTQQTKIEWADLNGRQRGVIKTAAKRLGVELEEYIALRNSGKKHCQICREWLSSNQFAKDSTRSDGLSSKCMECGNRKARDNYTPVPEDQRKPMGPAPKVGKDGDKMRARRRVNVMVRTGRLPHPNEVPCTDCGHEFAEGERRHEYDHHLGYAAEHHECVEAVCTTGHGTREKARGTLQGVADANSRRHNGFPAALMGGEG